MKQSTTQVINYIVVGWLIHSFVNILIYRGFVVFKFKTNVYGCPLNLPETFVHKSTMLFIDIISCSILFVYGIIIYFMYINKDV